MEGDFGNPSNHTGYGGARIEVEGGVRGELNHGRSESAAMWLPTGKVLALQPHRVLPIIERTHVPSNRSPTPGSSIQFDVSDGDFDEPCQTQG